LDKNLFKNCFKNRLKGVLFGQVVGDALGLGTEFMSRKDLSEETGDGDRSKGREGTAEVSLWNSVLKTVGRVKA
jgi:ADP-ribosylglycohydrolase